jgi:hypothetical protein
MTKNQPSLAHVVNITKSQLNFNLAKLSNLV